MKKIFIFGAMAVFAMTGCSKENGNDVPQGATGVEFRGTIEKTRASLIDNSSELSSFFVHAYQANATSQATTDAFGFLEAPVYRTGGSDWAYAPKKYFPTNDDFVNFYAYSPIKDVNMADFTTASGEASFTYTVPVEQQKSNTSTDLLVSAALEKISTDGTVAFMFDHALSAATFSARNSNPVGTELVYVVESVTIMAADNTGTFTYNNDYDGGTTPAELIGEWSDNDSYDQNYQAGINASGVAVAPVGASGAYAKLLSENDYMMVLPQALTAGTLDTDGVTPMNDGAYVAVTFSLRDGTGAYIFNGYTRYIPLTHTFVMGTRYNFQISFDPGTDPALVPIEMTVTGVNDWAAPTPDPTPIP